MCVVRGSPHCVGFIHPHLLILSGPTGLVIHTDDMGYFFGCGATPPGPEPYIAPDSIEAVTRRRLVALLANFIKTG